MQVMNSSSSSEVIMASRLHQDFLSARNFNSAVRNFLHAGIFGFAAEINLHYFCCGYERKEINGCEIGLNSFKFSRANKGHREIGRAVTFKADYTASQSIVSETDALRLKMIGV